jgi:Alpha/beta hydrolase domain
VPVARFEVTVRRPLAGGRSFGETGAYEELAGRLHFTVDPGHAANRAITDVALAPRDPSGRVAFVSDVSILLPVDRSRSSGTLILDVVNRGNRVTVPDFNHATRPILGPTSDPHPPIDAGDGWLMRRGWVVASCGWQCDLPTEIRGLVGMEAPDALGPDGRPLTGRLYVQLQAPVDVPHFLISDRAHRPYPAADLHERDAVLVVRDRFDGPVQVIPRDRWRFARVESGRVVPDASHAYLEGGFEKGRIYQLAYTGVGARVLGLGMAALRECVTWLKHGSAAEGNPAPGAIRHAYAYGRSQTGRLLRTMIHLDLNVDESGRRSLDGVIANVAGAMLGEFNQRFGQNSKDRPEMMDCFEPFQVEPRGGLKAFYTNTSFEYHRGDASLIHTDPAGTRDVEHGPDVRVYHWTGTEHGHGIWPPADAAAVAADPRGWRERARNLRSVVHYGRLLRAALVNLDRWVTEGVPPPPSCHPRLADSTAVDPGELEKFFARIPAAAYPRYPVRAQRQDFSTLPPKPGPALGNRVSAVDADGNERAGIPVPELTVPLATHTGWNLRHPESGGVDQILYFAGSTLPFVRTRAEREAAGDPRPAIAERYASRADYLARVREAAQKLVDAGYLLEEDIETSVAYGERNWDAWAGKNGD